MATQEPELADVLEAAMEHRLARFWTALPAVVTAYDSGTKTVSAQPLVKQGYYDEDGQRAVERLQVVTSAPVVFLGGGGYRTTYPIKAGDQCLLIMTSAALDKLQGVASSDSMEVDPGDDLSRNTLGHSVALVGKLLPGVSWEDVPTAFMSLGKDNGPVIECDETEIRVGGSGADKTILATPWFQALAPLMAALQAIPAAWITDGSVTAPFVATTTAMAALTTAINTFTAAWAGVMSTIGKVK